MPSAPTDRRGDSAPSRAPAGAAGGGRAAGVGVGCRLGAAAIPPAAVHVPSGTGERRGTLPRRNHHQEDAPRRLALLHQAHRGHSVRITSFAAAPPIPPRPLPPARPHTAAAGAPSLLSPSPSSICCQRGHGGAHISLERRIDRIRTRCGAFRERPIVRHVGACLGSEHG